MRRFARTPPRQIPLLALVTGAALMVLPTTPALANKNIKSPGPLTNNASGPLADITSTGPLTNISTSSDLNCQVNHTGDASGEFFGTPGACGTLIAIGGTLYGPATIPAGPTTVGFTPVSQTPVTGTGTTADPFTVVTVVDVPSTSLQITQTDTYVNGQESYRTDVQIANTASEGVATGVVYRAGDCYLGGSDSGYGIENASPGSIACSAGTASGSRVAQWTPISPGSNYLETTYGALWSAVASQTNFGNTCDCATFEDNGSGLSWSFNVPAASSVTESSTITISSSAACPPDAVAPDAPTNIQAFGGDQSAAVSWDAPVNDGGASIQSYTVNVTDQSTEAPATEAPASVQTISSSVQTTDASTSTKIDGLTNGDPYVFTVQATNCAGTGPASGQSNQVTPSPGTSAEVIGPGNLSQTTGTPPPTPGDTTIGVQVFPAGTTGIGTLEELPPGSAAPAVRGAAPVDQFCGGSSCIGNVLQAELHNGSLGGAFYKIKLFLDSTLVTGPVTDFKVWYDGNLLDDNAGPDPTPPVILDRCTLPLTTPCISRLYFNKTLDLKIVVKSSDLDPRLTTSK